MYDNENGMVQDKLNGKKKRRLQIYHTRELLDSVQEEVSLLDSCLIKSILGIGSVGFKNTGHFINLAMQFTSCYKTRKFPVDK